MKNCISIYIYIFAFSRIPFETLFILMLNRCLYFNGNDDYMFYSSFSRVQIANAVNEGKLVPEEIIFTLLSKRLEEGYSRGETGFILDGIPRTRMQAVSSVLKHYLQLHELYGCVWFTLYPDLDPIYMSTFCGIFCD